jgi:hypothetical protein
MTTKVYLGDSVYIALEDNEDNSMVVLTTEDGIKVSNVIYLDSTVLEHLLRVLVEWGLLRREGQHV